MTLPALQDAERTRYHRHLLLSDVGEEGQRRLKGASALIVGVGGLGSPIALYLAAAGVGRLGLVDDDRVSLNNLQRQVIHDTPHVDCLKVESAAERIYALNPLVQVEPCPAHLTEPLADELFPRYDLILDATDNFASRQIINAACVRHQKPMVYGAVYQLEGQISLLAPHLGGACYACVFPSAPPELTQPVGILGALPGVIGALQALQALKLILHIGEPLLNQLLVVDTLENRFLTIRTAPRADCPVCGGRGARP